MYRANFPDDPGMHNRFVHLRTSRPTSFWEVLKSTWLTSGIGFTLYITGLLVTFYNEGRAVQTARSLDEALRDVRKLQTIDVVFDENNAKLVYLVGKLSIEEDLVEPDYEIAIKAVKLKRRVQMYQWVEQESSRQVDDGEHQRTETTYSYDKEWKDKLVDSDRFYIPTDHLNPKEIPVKSRIQENTNVRIGNFILGNVLKKKFSRFVQFTNDERPTRRDIKLHAGLYYHSQDVWNPQVGEIRVQFSYAGHVGDVVTIIAMQSGRELRPYITSADREILILRSGRKSVEDIFAEEHTQARMMTWMLRFLGWFLAFLGLNCLSKLLHILVNRYPLLRDILTFNSSSLSFSVSMSTSLIIVAFGWIFFRPLLGSVLLTAATAPFLYSLVRVYRRDRLENSYRRHL